MIGFIATYTGCYTVDFYLTKIFLPCEVAASFETYLFILDYTGLDKTNDLVRDTKMLKSEFFK